MVIFKYLEFLVVSVELHSSCTVSPAPLSSGVTLPLHFCTFFCQEVSKLLQKKKKSLILINIENKTLPD